LTANASQSRQLRTTSNGFSASQFIDRRRRLPARGGSLIGEMNQTTRARFPALRRNAFVSQMLTQTRFDRRALLQKNAKKSTVEC